MESNINKMLMTAIYVFIFIVATSISVYLMYTVLNYSDKALEYTEKMAGSSLNASLDGIYKKYNAFTGSEVISMILNYGYKSTIKSSKYPSDFTYGVKVSVEGVNLIGVNNGDGNLKINYSELLDAIDLHGYYSVNVINYNSHKDQEIKINKIDRPYELLNDEDIKKVLED